MSTHYLLKTLPTLPLLLVKYPDLMSSTPAYLWYYIRLKSNCLPILSSEKNFKKPYCPYTKKGTEFSLRILLSLILS